MQQKTKEIYLLPSVPVLSGVPLARGSLGSSTESTQDKQATAHRHRPQHGRYQREGWGEERVKGDKYEMTGKI